MYTKILGTDWDVHLCKWPVGTFYSKTNFHFSRDAITIRFGLFELELSSNNTIMKQEELL